MQRLAERLVPLAFGLVVFLLVSSASTRADDAAGPIAVHYGVQIALADVARYHCHDGSYPVIRCFDTPAERDADIATAAHSLDGPDTLTIVYYVTFFADAGYSGASFTASGSISDMRAIGWNDQISSFKSLNDGRPRWWRDINFAGTAWQWGTGAWISYVGSGANDQFSSVANEP